MAQNLNNGTFFSHHSNHFCEYRPCFLDLSWTVLYLNKKVPNKNVLNKKVRFLPKTVIRAGWLCLSMASFVATQVQLAISDILACRISKLPPVDWIKFASSILSPFFSQWLTLASGLPLGGWQRISACLPISIC